MDIKRLGTFTAFFLNSDTQKSFPSLKEAQDAAEQYCGNNVYSKPFPGEESYSYGPGDGTTSVMIRENIEFVKC